MTTNPVARLADVVLCAPFASIAEAVLVADASVEAPDFVELAHVLLHPAAIDLSRVAELRIERLRELEPHRKVDIIVHRRMAVIADPLLIGEALAQLIDNAWTATAEARDAWIEVGTRIASDGERQFYVSDNGAGFDPASCGNLFEPPMTRYREETCSGPGKGLARAARILRRHGGRLQGDGAPGMGAEFCFTVGTAPADTCSLDA